MSGSPVTGQTTRWHSVNTFLATDLALLAAFETVPRTPFMPPAWFEPYDPPGFSGWQAIRRDELTHDELVTAAHRDTGHAAELDGHVNAEAVSDHRTGMPSNCTTSPGIAATILDDLDLDLESGQRVLEIGTGTGYLTALLSHRLGDSALTTIDIDPVAVERAQTALHEVGYHPRIVCGDGLDGAIDGAPYDRIVSTCAVPYLPPAWIDQARDGAVIVTGLGSAAANISAIARFAVHNGRAEGDFTGIDVHSEVLPPVMPSPPELRTLSAHLNAPGTLDRVRQTALSDDLVFAPFDQPELALLTRLSVPGLIYLEKNTPGRSAETWLLDPGRGSAAAFIEDSYKVHLAGPMDLWADIEATVVAWESLGRPSLDEFQITATATDQTVWLDRPGQPMAFHLPVPGSDR